MITAMATITVDPADPLALHKLIYLNKIQTLKMFLAPYTAQHSSTVDVAGADGTHDTCPQKKSHHHPQINTLDHHLLAPLHLAVMLNRKEAVSLLLKAGANPMVRSGTGWTPRQEATSLGDRDMIELLTRHQRKEFSGSFKHKAMNLVKQLSNVPTFILLFCLDVRIIEAVTHARTVYQPVGSGPVLLSVTVVTFPAQIPVYVPAVEQFLISNF